MLLRIFVPTYSSLRNPMTIRNIANLLSQVCNFFWNFKQLTEYINTTPCAKIRAETLSLIIWNARFIRNFIYASKFQFKWLILRTNEHPYLQTRVKLAITLPLNVQKASVWKVASQLQIKPQSEQQNLHAFIMRATCTRRCWSFDSCIR